MGKVFLHRDALVDFLLAAKIYQFFLHSKESTLAQSQSIHF